MSYKNLKKFVRDQAIKGADPVSLREGLVLNGWESKDVDKAISEIYGLKKKIKKTTMLIVLLIVIILSVSLLLLFAELFYEDKEIEDDDSEELPGEEIIEVDDSCALIGDISLKEECYLEEIEAGYGCEGLREEELFYCNRVLESYLVAGFS